jgi:hypothetical protein
MAGSYECDDVRSDSTITHQLPASQEGIYSIELVQFGFYTN